MAKIFLDGDKNSGQNPALNRFLGKRQLMKKEGTEQGEKTFK